MANDAIKILGKANDGVITSKHAANKNKTPGRLPGDFIYLTYT